ncbi:MAG: hypothetical protein N7Q72_01925, partial [Spiroplasma sp. Tabriz.8]|nr:hypothetical protein [Spiroplasma sp. Tabriz.8]
ILLLSLHLLSLLPWLLLVPSLPSFFFLSFFIYLFIIIIIYIYIYVCMYMYMYIYCLGWNLEVGKLGLGSWWRPWVSFRFSHHFYFL